MKKILFIVALMFPMILVAQSETEPGTSHYLNFSVGAGLHSNAVHTTTKDVSALYGGGALIDLQYQYIPNHWGLGVGIQGSSINSGIMHHNLNFITKPANTILEYHIRDMKELEHMLLVKIPVQALCVYPIAEDWQIMAGLGANVAFPVYGAYNTRSGAHYTVGVFNGTTVSNASLNNPDFDLKKVENIKGRTRYQMLNVGIMADLGFIYQATEKYALSFGVYGNYNVLDAQSQTITTPYSEANSGTHASKLVEDIHPFEVGMKVGVRFTLPDKKREKQIAEEQEARRIEEERQAQIAREEAERQAALAAAKAEEERLERERQKAEAERIAREEAERIQREENRLKEALIKAESHYRFGSAAFRAEEETEESILTVKEYLDNHPGKVLVITGHTDYYGENDYNMLLGEYRAESYRRFCKRMGFTDEQLHTRSAGASAPVATNNTAEGRAKNRHITLEIK